MIAIIRDGFPNYCTYFLRIVQITEVLFFYQIFEMTHRAFSYTVSGLRNYNVIISIGRGIKHDHENVFKK
jgi:hypothetical protein